MQRSVSEWTSSSPFWPQQSPSFKDAPLASAERTTKTFTLWQYLHRRRFPRDSPSDGPEQPVVESPAAFGRRGIPLTALLLPQIFPIFSVVAPCQRGASL